MYNIAQLKKNQLSYLRIYINIYSFYTIAFLQVRHHRMACYLQADDHFELQNMYRVIDILKTKMILNDKYFTGLKSEHGGYIFVLYLCSYLFGLYKED